MDTDDFGKQNRERVFRPTRTLEIEEKMETSELIIPFSPLARK